MVLAMLATRSEAGEISNTRMAVRKVRGARSGYEIPYNLEVVTLGLDEDDEPVTTCIVTWQTQAEQAPQPTKAKERWPQSLRVFRTALSTVLIDDGKDAWPFGSEGPKVLAARVSALRDEFCRAIRCRGRPLRSRPMPSAKASLARSRPRWTGAWSPRGKSGAWITFGWSRADRNEPPDGHRTNRTLS